MIVEIDHNFTYIYGGLYHHLLIFVIFRINLGILVCWLEGLESVFRVGGIRSRVRSLLYLYEGR
jgi:hypothetical protein